MPLVSASMVQGFLSLAAKPPKDRPTVAKMWAQYYDAYAQLAVTANGGAFIFTGQEKTLLEATLLPALLLPIGVPATAAAAWGIGLTAYWGAPPVLTTPAPIPVPPFTLPGIAAPPIGVQDLVEALTALYLIPASPAPAFAAAQAAALDLCTRTVLVTFGPGGPFPIL